MSVLPLLLVAKATAILAVAALLTRLLRPAPAAARHLVWCCAVAALLLLPALSLLLPRWEVGLWTDTRAAVREDVAWLPAPEAPGEAAPSGAASAPSAEPSPAAPPALLPRPADVDAGWLALTWALGAALVLLRLAAGQIGLRRMRRRAGPTDASIRWLAREMSGALGLRRQVELLRSPTATMPMTWGVLRPTVLLPAESDDWPMERRRAVVLHELAHVQRLDCLTQTLALVCCAAYWFHPGVWWAARRMRVEREPACDDAVLGTGFRPSEYAAQLLEIARAYRDAGLTQVAAVAMARPSQLEGRMLAVLDAARARSAPTRRAMLRTGAATVLLLLPVSALRPTARAASAPPEALAADTIPAPRPVPTPAPAPRVWGDGAVADLRLDAGREAALAAEARVGGPLTPAVDAAVESAVAAAAVAWGWELDHAGHAAPRAPAAPAAPRPVRALRWQADPAPADPRAVAALVEALGDSDAGVRRAAAQGLGEMESPQAVAALSQTLRDTDAEVRRTAAWALGQIEDRRAVPGLVATLRDAAPEVRRMAAWALGRMEGPEAVPGLIAALGDASAAVRAMAAHALGEAGDRRAVDPLIAALRDPDAEVQRMAAAALAELEDPRAAGPLAAALTGASGDVARLLVRALSRLDLEAAPQPLLDAVRSSDAGVRRAAVQALAEIGDPRAVPSLRTALRDADADVRRAAVRALVELDDPAGLDALIEALRDPDAEVRREAARAIGRGSP